MKKLLFIIALLVPMVLTAQTRKFSEIVTDADTIETTADADFFYIIEDPLGTPDSKAIRTNKFIKSSDGVTSGLDLWLLADTIIIGSAPALDSFNTTWFYPLVDNGAASDSLLISTAQYRCTGTTVDFNISIFADDTINSSTPSDTIIYNFNVTDESGDLINITTLNDLILGKDKVAYWKGESFTVAPDWFMITLFGSRLNRTY